MNDVVTHPLDFPTRAWELLLSLSEKLVRWLATSGVRIVIILVLAWLAIAVVQRLIERIHELLGADTSPEQLKRTNTLTAILRGTMKALIVAAAFMMAMNEVGIAIGPILATAGIGGIAVGFGAQSLVKDVISGLFLLIDDRLRVGDVVQIGGRTGVVEAIHLRTVQLRDDAGNLQVIPNGTVDVITNMTKDWARAVIDVTVPAKSDPARIFAALTDVGAELRKDPATSQEIRGDVEVLGIEAVGAANMVIRARVTTSPGRQWHVAREFRRRLRQTFADRGLELA